MYNELFRNLTDKRFAEKYKIYNNGLKKMTTWKPATLQTRLTSLKYNSTNFVKPFWQSDLLVRICCHKLAR